MDRYADTLLMVARDCAGAGDHAAADAVVRLVLGSNPPDAEVLRRVAGLRRTQGRPDAALRCARAAYDLAPDDAATRELLGDLLWARGEPTAAAEHYHQALAIEPERVQARRSLGLLLKATNREAEAVTQFHHVLRRCPNRADIMLDLAGALHRLRRYDESQATLTQALRLDPASSRAETALGYVLLQQGGFAAGWARHEARLRAPDHPGHCFDAFPRWHGEDPAGRIIVLHAEQGIGDTIQFIRYAPLLAARGARVIAAIQQALAPLIAHQSGIASVIVPGQDVPAFDLHCPMLSLGFAFGTELATIPSGTPYVVPAADRVAAWRDRLGPATRPRVGLAVAGNPEHVDDRNRSIPLAAFAALLVRQDVEFHLVQPLLRAWDQDTARGMPALRDHGAALADFADTAALLSLMDLTISVDTAVAHLAGALARPTWLLLPFAADWRWLADDRTDTPWYPTLHLFRQSRPGDWESVLREIAGRLASWR